jgi:large subunit ribosomal protein L21e
MLKHKRARERGKPALSKVFKEYKEGDKVCLIWIPGQTSDLPRRYHGRTGVIDKGQGKAFVVKVKDGGKVKKFIVKRIHLKKLSS